ncbi:N-6 DNA methylase [Streptomyces globisporus]|uniref:N-6 DNA methylase n=1 Tax=Streptomyces globisporus TaxID=1908 RepID=UPI003800A240
MADVVVIPEERGSELGRLKYRRVLLAVEKLRSTTDAETTYRLAFQVVYLHCWSSHGAAVEPGRPWRPGSGSAGAMLNAIWPRTPVARTYNLPACRDEGVSRPFELIDPALRELIVEVRRLEPDVGLFDVLLDMYSTRYSRGDDYFTPNDLAYLFAGLAAPRGGEVVRDPVCGSGRLLRAAAYRARTQGGEVRLSGADLNPTARYAAAVNLALHGFHADLGKGEADSLRAGTSPEPADVIVANPPVNLRDWGHGELKDDRRWTLEVPRPGNANFAWVQHILADLTPQGRAVVLLSPGAAHSSNSTDGLIRRRLLENGLVVGVVALSAWLFPHTSTSMALWLLAKGERPNTHRVLFADAGNLPTARDGSRRIFDQDSVERLLQIFGEWQGLRRCEDEGAPESAPWCRAASLEEIADAGFDLTPARYVRNGGTAQLHTSDGDRSRKAELYECMDRSAAARNRVRDALESRHDYRIG